MFGPEHHLFKHIWPVFFLKERMLTRKEIKLKSRRREIIERQDMSKSFRSGAVSRFFLKA